LILALILIYILLPAEPLIIGSICLDIILKKPLSGQIYSLLFLNFNLVESYKKKKWNARKIKTISTLVKI
jgi:hypothetical protein